MLETLPNLYPDREYEICLRMPLRCRCPVNGKTDDADVNVKYVPTAVLVEYSAFHTYVDSFAGIAVTHEKVTNDIFDTLQMVLAPQRLQVRTTWRAIEGVQVSVVVGA